MKAELTAITDLYPDIKAFFLKPEAPFSYRAGQYIRITFDGFEPRAYSVASAPAEDGILEIHIKNFGPGGASYYATHELAVGDIVDIDGPFGNCVYDRAAPARPVLMVAGGLGVTPLKAVIEEILGQKEPVPVSLYWGVRFEEELYMRRDFEELARSNDCFSFHPVIGDYVGPVAMADYADLGTAEIFLSGPPVMISSMITLLQDAGVQRAQIHYDTHPEASDGKAADDKAESGG